MAWPRAVSCADEAFALRLDWPARFEHNCCLASGAAIPPACFPRGVEGAARSLAVAWLARASDAAAWSRRRLTWPPLTGRIAQAQAGAGACGARPQAAFQAAGRGMLSDVQTEIEAWQGKSSSVA